MDVNQLQSLNIKELAKVAQDLEIAGYSGLNKQDLIVNILETQNEKEGVLHSKGVLEVLNEGYGFLRSPDFNYLPGPDDIYVSPSQIKRFGLRTGHSVYGQIRKPKDKERFYALLKMETVNDKSPDHVKQTVFLDFAVQSPTGIEDLVPTMLRVGLGKHHQLDIKGIPAQSPKTFFQVDQFIIRQRQPEPKISFNQIGPGCTDP